MSKRLNGPFSISMFKCPDCGCKMFVPRNKGKQRKNGHIKDLYCSRCDEIKKMVEEKNYI